MRRDWAFEIWIEEYVWNSRYCEQKLRKRLEKHHMFSTTTDSEVIVHLLEDHLRTNTLLDAIRYTLAELDGVYALAIQDKKTGATVLVRDRIGVRQLYYVENSRFVA